ncbi:hypothetical protein SLEP1_g37117 [Rubroshorea leprosula]|uniref:Uncharacterized protein n=1 Tax=Rubroshorea leprosula TaxID=152421 RepID=A0AAV5KTN4_9ROSI|nr:hypothetical protein SLEP1_g37117 [Rubroshorea leprosula]
MVISGVGLLSDWMHIFEDPGCFIGQIVSQAKANVRDRILGFAKTDASSMPKVFAMNWGVEYAVQDS